MPDKFESEENISRLPYGEVDSIITSPPYENQDSYQMYYGPRATNRKGDDSKTRVKKDYVKGESQENIGNLKSTSYLEAMRQVYAEMWKVLKPGGKAVIVVRNFIRNKKVVDLAGDTIKLCESVDFKLVEHVLFKLPQLSFWRILYRKKFPEVDVSGVEKEHVLVFKKEVPR